MSQSEDIPQQAAAKRARDGERWGLPLVIFSLSLFLAIIVLKIMFERLLMTSYFDEALIAGQADAYRVFLEVSSSYRTYLLLTNMVAATVLFITIVVFVLVRDVKWRARTLVTQIWLLSAWMIVPLVWLIERRLN